MGLYLNRDPCVKNLLHLTLLLPIMLGLNQAVAAEPGKQKKLPLVVVAEVIEGQVGEWLERRAVLEPKQLVKVLNEEPGRISEILVHEGDQVRVGELLAQQDDGLVRAEWLKQKARREQVTEEWRRLQILRQEGMISAEAYTQSRTLLKVAIADERLLAKRLAYMNITAPLTGVVSERLVEEGDVAERYQHLFSIMDLTTLKTRVAVEAEQLAYLSENTPVQISSDRLMMQAYPARVARIFPALDVQTHQATVEIELLPDFRELHPGQLVTVRLALQAGRFPLIPLNALRQDQGGTYVFRLQADQTVERVAVSAGRYLGERVEIRQGLKAGEQVVVRGFSGLKSRQQVDVVAADVQP